MTYLFCLHYFLWCGALTSILSYEGVYARQYADASTMQFGYLSSALPFANVVAAPLVCSLADRHRAHRNYFALTLVATTLVLALYSALPLTHSNTSPGAGPGAWPFYCVICLLRNLAGAINTCLADSFAVAHAERTRSSFGRIVVWGTLGWAASAFVLALINQIDSLPRLLPGLVYGVFLLTLDTIIVCFWSRSADFRLTTTQTRSARSSRRLLRTRSSSRSPPATRSGSKPSVASKLHSVKTLSGSKSSTKSPKSTKSTKSPKSPKKSPSALKSGPKSDPVKPAAQSAPPELFNGGLAMQSLLLLLVLSQSRQLARYLFLFVLAGFFMSMHWNYFFLYMDNLEPDRFQLVSALSMLNQSLLGELPFFIVSRKIISALGRSNALSLSVFSIGLRFLLYRYLLPARSLAGMALADCLQGPNYGLFYVLMAEVSLNYAHCDDSTIQALANRGYLDSSKPEQVEMVRGSMRTTIQSVAFACYEGLGVGLGSLAGGWLLSNYGFEMLWLWAGLGAMAVAGANLATDLFTAALNAAIHHSEAPAKAAEPPDGATAAG